MKTKVAVYGSLRRLLGNHGLLENSTYLGEEWTGEGYKMISLGGFPGVLLDETAGKIKIEVYEVDAMTASRLDMLEGYHGENNPNNFYNRETIETVHGDAFIYYINDRYNESTNEIVTTGDWTEYYMNKKKTYLNNY